MVVLIVAMVLIARIVSRGGRQGRQHLARINDGTTERLQDEIRQLKDRLAVLERIATDGNTSLERQIEALRDRRDHAPPAPRSREVFGQERE